MSLTSTLSHRLVPMSGRDPHESHRVASPLELLFDLAFAVAFGVAGNQFAHLLAEGHLGPAIGGFSFAIVAIVWAWINFTWFASAYDTDDWGYRLTTLLQMVGVVVLALGLPDMFHSLDAGHGFDNRVMVAGYVIMRIAMLIQWLRVARQDPLRRRAALTYATAIAVAQVGWVFVAVGHLPLATTVGVGVVLQLIELSGPVLAERKAPTPWHPHHIAERYSLLTIIALGEGVFGTVASVTAVIEAQHRWTFDAAVLVAAGIAITFGL